MCGDSIIAVNFNLTFAVSRAFMVGLGYQPVDTDSSQPPGLASRFQESMNVHRGTGVSTAVTMHQFFFYFTLVNDIYYKIKRIPKFICSWIKVPTKYNNFYTPLFFFQKCSLFGISLYN